VVDVFDAGHIPGSSAFLVEIDGIRVLYTGDFNTNKTRLLNEAKIDAKDVDVLITESTYAAKEHPNRKQTEEKLLETIRGTLANDGVVLIPSFAIGRSAEVLLTLESFKDEFPVYMDGMAVAATQIALRYPEYLRSYKTLKRAFNNVTFLRDNLDRKRAVKEPGVIVTTSGMMEGGPIIQYMKYLYNNPQSSIIFVGFLIPKTAGRYLLNTGRFVNEDIDLKVKMNIHALDFSAHLGRTDLFKFVQKIDPKKIVCLHGDHCQRFAMELRGRGYDAIAPNNGDSITV
jgi:putative mRNA 3-end processing factor